MTKGLFGMLNYYYLQALFHLYRVLLPDKVKKVKLKDVVMYIDFKTPGISKSLFINKTREEDMIYLIKKFYDKKGDIIDCGSNMGFYPLLESSLMPSAASILCIEPDPRNFRVLMRNAPLIRNDINVHIENIAVSNTQGEMTLDVSVPSNLNKIDRNSKHVSSTQTQKNSGRISVKVHTVDDLVERYKLKPSFLRMDIEGHEVEVIEGMKKTLINASIGFVLFFELHPDEYSVEHSLSDKLDFLYENGFAVRAIVSAGTEQPAMYKTLNLSPDEVIETDGLLRGIYYDVDKVLAVKLATATPKASRYILLQKVS